MNRDINYMRKTIEQLIEMYNDENSRANKADAEETQKRIVNEMYARVKTVFAALDSGKQVNTKSLYKYFLQAAKMTR